MNAIIRIKFCLNSQRHPRNWIYCWYKWSEISIFGKSDLKFMGLWRVFNFFIDSF